MKHVVQILAEHIPEYGEWLRRSGELAVHTIRIANSTLEGCTSEEVGEAAVAVLAEMASGRKVQFSQLPFVIKDHISRKRKARTIAAFGPQIYSETVACKDCEDTGMVIVYNPEFLQLWPRLREFDKETIHRALVQKGIPKTVAMQCRCRTGSERYGLTELPLFLPDKHQVARYALDEKSVLDQITGLTVTPDGEHHNKE